MTTSPQVQKSSQLNQNIQRDWSWRRSASRRTEMMSQQRQLGGWPGPVHEVLDQLLPSRSYAVTT